MKSNPEYFAPLVTLPTVIDAPGKYVTRNEEVVTIFKVSDKHNFGCKGTYEKVGTIDLWHKTGRIFAGLETPNDIISKLSEA